MVNIRVAIIHQLPIILLYKNIQIKSAIIIRSAIMIFSWKYLSYSFNRLFHTFSCSSQLCYAIIHAGLLALLYIFPLCFKSMLPANAFPRFMTLTVCSYLWRNNKSEVKHTVIITFTRRLKPHGYFLTLCSTLFPCKYLSILVMDLSVSHLWREQRRITPSTWNPCKRWDFMPLGLQVFFLHVTKGSTQSRAPAAAIQSSVSYM